MTKTNKRRRIVSVLLVLTMLLTMVPITAVTTNAVEGFVEVSTYEQLRNEVDKGSAKIKLVADIDTTSENGGVGVTTATNLSFKGSGNVLDLNGHKLKLVSKMSVYFIKIYSTDLTIKDSGTNGRIDFEYGEAVVGIQRAIVISRSVGVKQAGSLTVDGGTLSSTYDGIILIESFGSITINGGRLYAPVSHLGNGDYLIRSTNSYDLDDTLQLHVTGGELDGRVVLKRDDSSATGTLKYKVTPIKITGGTFKQGLYATWKTWDSPEGEPKNAVMTMDSPTVEITGGVFEKNNEEYSQAASSIRIDLPTKLRGGTFKNGAKIRFVGGEYTWDGTQPQYRASIGNSAILHGNDIRTAYGWSKSDWFELQCPWIYLSPGGTSVTVIPNAWGMKSVTLDGTEINYAKDWKGIVERMDNSTAHTLKFEWYPLASELVNAGYSYRAECDRYVSGNKTPTTDTISATDTEYSFTIPAGADPKVYSFDLHLNLKKDGSSVGIFSNEHIVKLVVSEAPPEPPAPVAHSIKITNGRGTASTTSAFAGETVTVTAKDDTANYMMFTQWYAKTAGVTFADATKQETTFVMPDCDVEVNPGFQQVSFTNQPTDSWLSSVDDSKVYFAFSQPITSWKLVNEDNTTLASGNAESAKALVAATLGPKPDKTEMTCRVIVTSNGQNFTSRTFDLKWYNVPGAPDVTVYPEGGKFVETLDVKLKTPNTYWGIAYTTDGSDPYDKSGKEWLLTPSAKIVDDSTQVTISKDTTIKACLYNYEGYSNMEKFGDIVTCDFTKVELTPPVADPPSGTNFYDSLNVSLSTDIVNAKIMVSYNNGDVDDLSDPNQWKEYEPEKESITLSGSYGMHGFDAVTGIQMEHPDGYTYWVHSDKQDYLYPRISYATIADASVVGKVNKEITPVDVSITLSGDVFAEDLTAGTDVSGWFTNLPAGLTAKVKERTNYTATLVITISGTPTATSAAAISVEMPKSALRYTGTGTAIELTVLFNPKAVYNIGMDADHQHDYSGQPYLYLDPGNHYQECKADDGYNIQAHEFTPWTDNGNGTHSRHCTVCKMTDGSTYTETAEHTWVWVVDQEAALDQPGKQHEECTGCHAKRSENTEIPALRDYAVTVTGGTATVAAGTPITRAMEGVEVTVTAQAPDGKHFVKWVVKAGGVTLANETSATTTFTMPANDVTIEAEFTENPVESYTLTVIKGTASVAAGTPITDKIEQNTVVTVTANAPEAGKVFDKWVVLDGNVTLADATKATTTFTMPGNDVKLEATYKDAPPSHTHSYGTEWKYDDTDHWHECECGDKADVAAHSASEWIVDTAATETADGTKHKECTVCKKVLETATIPATGSTHTHSYGTEWKYDGTNHWHECECGDKTDTAAHSFQWVIDKAATKEATGIKHEECTVCGAKRSENTVIDKLPDSGNTDNTGSGDNNTDKPGNDDSTKCPQTGDSNNHIGWLAALYVSGGVLTVLGVSSKKRKKSEVE